MKATNAKDARAEIEELYEVDEHGIITSPGKFENEQSYVPWLWACSTDNPARVDVTPEDREVWPNLADVYRVYLYEYTDGFVAEITEASYMAFQFQEE